VAKLLKVIDLFSGVGGMSLGASRAGFNVIGAIELDPIAISSHNINFPNTSHIEADISTIKSQDIVERFKFRRGELSGIIGGPPCQGFSTMGKQKILDPRNSLFTHFFRIVSDLEPDYFVAENVPGILDSKFDAIRSNAFSLVSGSYNILEPILISAKEVGAPTIRKRIFFIGFHKRVTSTLSPLHFKSDVINPVYVKDAFEGLPSKVEYDESVWTKLESLRGKYIQEISKPIIESIGDPYSKEKYFVFNEVTGVVGTKHRQDVISRFMNIQQGEVESVSKAPRLNNDGFSPTLRAGTGKDRGSYQAVRPIHPTEPRVITPREAARIQGFPDWFQFHKTKWHSFRQIGNSVSPIVAEYVLKKVLNNLN
jgi:DNA (cytosine-5)-methyltransferase 1